LLDFCDGVWRACTTIKRLTNWMPGQTEIGNVLGFLDLVFGGPPMGSAWARLMPLSRSRLLRGSISIPACYSAIGSTILYLRRMVAAAYVESLAAILSTFSCGRGLPLHEGGEWPTAHWDAFLFCNLKASLIIHVDLQKIHTGLQFSLLRKQCAIAAYAPNVLVC